MTPELLAALTAARAAKRPVVVATRLPSGEQMLLPDPAALPPVALIVTVPAPPAVIFPPKTTRTPKLWVLAPVPPPAPSTDTFPPVDEISEPASTT